MTDLELLKLTEKAAKYDHLLPYLCKTCGGYGLIDRRSNEGPMDSEPCPNCSRPSGELLRHALELACDHIEMDSLRLSHCKDAAVIDAAMAAAQEGGKA